MGLCNLFFLLYTDCQGNHDQQPSATKVENFTVADLTPLTAIDFYHCQPDLPTPDCRYVNRLNAAGL